jgi:protein-tyrosine phosphatase
VRIQKRARPVKAFFVSKRLAFGSAIKTKHHVKELQALGITHVINLRWGQNNAKVRQFRHLWLRFHDDKKPRPRWYYKRAAKFHKKALKKSGSKLLVMCHHGICRSASLVYFLLRNSGLRPCQAEQRIRVARPTARIVTSYRKSGEEYLRQTKW